MNFDYSGVEELLDMSQEGEWQEYLKRRKRVYRDLVQENLQHNLVSEANWFIRGHSLQSGEEIGINVKVGDVVYMDFGQAYLSEVAYQHLGLIMAVCKRKAFVIPMTSNVQQFSRAYDDQENPEGKIHLMRLGKLPGMNRPSVLFLNDMKFVNTARVIDIKAHLNPNSVLFRRIQQRMMKVLFSEQYIR